MGGMPINMKELGITPTDGECESFSVNLIFKYN